MELALCYKICEKLSMCHKNYNEMEKQTVYLPNGNEFKTRETLVLRKCEIKIIDPSGKTLFKQKYPRGSEPLFEDGVIYIRLSENTQMVLSHTGKVIVNLDNSFKKTAKGHYIYERPNVNPNHEIKSICGLRNKDGETLIAIGPKEINESPLLPNGYLQIVYTNDEQAIANSDGKIIIAPNEYKLWGATKNCIIMAGGSKYYFFGLKGEPITVAEDVKPSSIAGEFFLKADKGWGVLDKDMEMIVPKAYKRIKLATEKSVVVVDYNDEEHLVNRQSKELSRGYKFVDINQASIGFAAKVSDRLWRALDEEGNFLFEIECDMLKPFCRGLKVLSYTKWGFIGWSGEELLAKRFKQIDLKPESVIGINSREIPKVVNF